MSAQSTRARGAFTVALLALAAWGLGSGDGDVRRPVSGQASTRPVAPARPIGLVASAPVAVAGHAAVVADELIVAPRASADAAAQAIADAGGVVAWRAPRTGMLLARFATADDAREARAMLAADARVGAVFTNHIMSGAGITTSPGAQQKWMISAMQLTPGAHRATGITVAVLDTGAAFENRSDATGTYLVAPDLANTSFAPGWDFVNNDPNPNDDQGHGTHISNIIAASATITPMAPGATIMPIKVLDRSNQGTELALAEAIRYAVDHGAHVINMSLSFPPGYFPSRFLQDAVDYANAQGVVMVAAAGNQNGDQVSFPAAFRDVIAVGASKLSSLYHPPRGLGWLLDNLFLVRAEYSNRGQKLQVAAPAGSMNGDADHDGFPEAVVAQTFVPGSTTQFQYRLWAGTSQAAAQVSGIAAAMLAKNPSLSPRQIASILGETAEPELGLLTLSNFVGRGYLDADAATGRAATESSDTRPEYAVALRLGITTSPGNAANAVATVEVLDASGHPVPRVFVYGAFSGAASASGMQRTDDSGVATFTSPALATPHVVAFEVDAIADRFVAPRVFDRPHGQIRIDTCSLEVLSNWAFAAGVAQSPGSNTGQGITTSPGASASGQGITTSPGAPITGQGITTSPVAMALPKLANETNFYELVNYSWSGSTMPMAVAVDAGWFHDNFPNAPIVTSFGQGITTSPLLFDPSRSFSTAVAPATDAPDGCTPVLVDTFVPGQIAAGLSPLTPDPSACGTACQQQQEALAAVWSWAATGQGITTSPGYTLSTAMTARQYDQAVVSAWAWAQFALQEGASPVSELGAVLDAAGITTSPTAQSADDPNAWVPLQ